MRIRSTVPDFFRDRRVQGWPVFARYVYLGMWSAADDSGRFEDAPKLLRADVAPLDPQREFDQAYQLLVDEERLALYEADGKRCGLVIHFPLYQRIDKPSPSLLPAPPEELATRLAERLTKHPRFRAAYSANLRRMLGEDSANVRRIVGEASEPSRTRASGAGSREQGAGSREQGAGSREQPDGLHLLLKESPSLRALTWEQDRMARQNWDGWRTGYTREVAKALADKATIGEPTGGWDRPGQWLSLQYGDLARAQAAGVRLSGRELQGVLWPHGRDGKEKKPAPPAEESRPTYKPMGGGSEKG